MLDASILQAAVETTMGGVEAEAEATAEVEEGEVTKAEAMAGAAIATVAGQRLPIHNIRDTSPVLLPRGPSTASSPLTSPRARRAWTSSIRSKTS